ncbi:MAG TPA: hypothetical protein VLK33_10750, partial [Terriglobales bacterium]|nr:hypothetical protein [Terriglobales bacterium]
MQHSAGYMDADYYQLTGQQLASGKGFTEPVLWNYLDDSTGLPHPSHAYWMPLASLVAAGGMAVGGFEFDSGRILFILIAATIPPLSAQLAWLLSKKKQIAPLAGGLALLPGFYLPYLPTTDTFAIASVLGGLFFLTLLSKKQNWFAIALGFIVGLMHLTRTEGLIWLAVVLAFSWFLSKRKSDLGRVLLGYLLIMGPWFIRNWLVFGSPLQPGAGHTLWLTSYDELFSFPASLLTSAHWLASGWGEIFSARLSALIQNSLSALIVEGLIFLAPLILLGIWKLRSNLSVRIAAAVWAALLVAMSGVFPFSGARGGFFHAAAALQPIFWALAAVGLESFVVWGAKQRGWQTRQAFGIFAAGALIFSAGLSIYVVKLRVVGSDLTHPSWDASFSNYTKLDYALAEIGIANNAIVM